MRRNASHEEHHQVDGAGVPGAGVTVILADQAQSNRLALKPCWQEPAVRHSRDGDGNVGIKRTPVRAIACPTHRPIPPLSAVLAEPGASPPDVRSSGTRMAGRQVRARAIRGRWQGAGRPPRGCHWIRAGCALHRLTGTQPLPSITRASEAWSKCRGIGLLGFLARPASESGRFCRGDGSHRRGDRGRGGQLASVLRWSYWGREPSAHQLITIQNIGVITCLL
jgi:hypothetical protein